MFATKGFMLALHVPASFARDKNRLVRALSNIGKSSIVDIKKEWTFLNEIRHLGFDMQRTTNIRADYPQSTSADGGHNMNSAVNTAKRVRSRLAKDKVSKEEYQELLKAIKSCNQIVLCPYTSIHVDITYMTDQVSLKNVDFLLLMISFPEPLSCMSS